MKCDNCGKAFNQSRWCDECRGVDDDYDQLRSEVEALKRACNLSRDALQEYDRLVANGDFYFNCKAHRSGPAQRAIDTAMNGGDVK